MYQHLTSSSTLSQSGAATAIDRLVTACLRSKSPAFHTQTSSTGKITVRNSRLSEYFSNIQHLLCIYDDKYDYSPSLELFWQVCHDIGLERSASGPVCRESFTSGYLSHHESMNFLVRRIRECAARPCYRRVAADQKRAMKERVDAFETYIPRVMEKSPRTTIVRLDLHYLQAVNRITRIEHVYHDLDTLIRRRERHPSFRYETGYLWCIEQGEDRGFHIHIAFLFDGRYIEDDWKQSLQIGELWLEITRDKGYFFSCNHQRHKAKFIKEGRLAVGIFERPYEAEYEKIFFGVGYVIKNDQPLLIKPNGRRTYGKGLMPKLQY